MTTPALEFADVGKTFAPGRAVLAGVSATIPRDGVTFVVGQSGSGKSVLCRLAVGLLSPTTGTVRLLGQPLQGLPERGRIALRRRAPYLVQGPALLDWLTVEKNVALAVPDAPADAVLHALERAGVAEHAGALPTTLGPATRKRVSLARALLLEPEYLLLDEPTTGLDSDAAAQVNDALAKLAAQGVGAMVVSHDFQALQALATRVLWLTQGRVGFWGPTRDFLTATDPAIQAQVAPGLAEANFHG